MLRVKAGFVLSFESYVIPQEQVPWHLLMSHFIQNKFISIIQIFLISTNLKIIKYKRKVQFLLHQPPNGINIICDFIQCPQLLIYSEYSTFILKAMSEPGSTYYDIHPAIAMKIPFCNFLARPGFTVTYRRLRSSRKIACNAELAIFKQLSLEISYRSVL